MLPAYGRLSRLDEAFKLVVNPSALSQNSSSSSILNHISAKYVYMSQQSFMGFLVGCKNIKGFRYYHPTSMLTKQIDPHHQKLILNTKQNHKTSASVGLSEGIINDYCSVIFGLDYEKYDLHYRLLLIIATAVNHQHQQINGQGYVQKTGTLFDPRGRPTVTAGSDHCSWTSSVRPSVPTFQNKTNFKRKQCLLLAILWVWPSGSLMTPVLYFFTLSGQFVFY